MDNQQERFDLRLAWLAGIIEGEGWVTLGLVKSLKRDKTIYPAYVPNIGLVNTDLSIVEESEEIFRLLNVKYRSQLRKAYIGSDGISRKEKKDPQPIMAVMTVPADESYVIVIHTVAMALEPRKSGRANWPRNLGGNRPSFSSALAVAETIGERLDGHTDFRECCREFSAGHHAPLS